MSKSKYEKELEKLGDEASNVFVPDEDNPDQFKKHPKIIICSTNPQKYMYPIMLKLEHSNIVRLQALNPYISTVLRIVDLFDWCMVLRLKRKRQAMNDKTNKKLITNEFILEKIPACRR